jgi:hypothetical protein
VLQVDAEGGVGGGGGEAGSSDDEEADADDPSRKATKFDDDLRALDLEVHVDLKSAQQAASNGELGRGELSLMKAILAQVGPGRC